MPSKKQQNCERLPMKDITMLPCTINPDEVILCNILHISFFFFLDIYFDTKYFKNLFVGIVYYGHIWNMKS